MNKLTWLKIKAQIGKKYTESLMPGQELGLLRLLSRKVTSLSTLYGIAVTHVRRKNGKDPVATLKFP